MKVSLLVLRSEIPLDLAKWYQSKFGGTIVEEKHGTGPLHYSISFDEFVLEFYPGKPTKTVFGLSIPLDMMSRMAELNGDNNVVIKDLDGNIVHIKVMG